MTTAEAHIVAEIAVGVARGVLADKSGKRWEGANRETILAKIMKSGLRRDSASIREAMILAKSCYAEIVYAAHIGPPRARGIDAAERRARNREDDEACVDLDHRSYGERLSGKVYS